ncbi:hypothetical protein ABMA28_005591 [Loxostege sticticalis]|uniref:Amine oxidase domain-containing protein n=1 Tax=Loxostege sticticalis TaxID=481309 RepID=A0ABD0SPJ0_LOXSC
MEDQIAVELKKRLDLESKSKTETEESPEEQKRPLKDVVVIGCGASGIAALSKLQESGLDVVGLEAGDRIGGRIHTTEFAGGVVDIGAAWCHGEENNIVYELASPHDLLGKPEGTEEEWFIFSNGTLMPTGNARAVITEFTDALHARGQKEKSISQFIREDAEKYPIVELGKIPKTKPFIEWYERDNHVGGQDDPKKGKSINGLHEHKICNGEFWLNWKGKGYKTILDVLLNKPPYSENLITPDIKLNKVVTSIKWQLEDEDTKKPYVEVLCEDGTKFAAKTAVITVSIGVLKESHKQLFTPALPDVKVKSIDNLQLCVLDKIYIEFATQWWPSSPASFKIIWKEENKQEFSADEKWITEIYGLRTVEHHPKVLLAWIYGKGAEEMEGKSETEVEAGVNKLMDKVFSLNFEVSKIVSIKRSQWAKNKFVRGAYSYRSVATEELGGSASDLATPLEYNGTPVVYFAGEATSVEHHNAVHGAIETGREVADKIVKTLPRN